MGNLQNSSQSLLQLNAKTNLNDLNMFSKAKIKQCNSQTIIIYREQINEQKKLFQFRLTHKNVLVHCFGFEIQQSKQQNYFQNLVCMKGHIDSLHITFHSEKINKKMKDLYYIPVQQGLQILQNSIKGFSVLYDYFGYFQPLLSMIMKQGNQWKVWINQDVFSIQPTKFQTDQHKEQFQKLKIQNQKKIFFRQVVHLFDILRDENCPQFSYSKFIFGKFIQATEIITQNQILSKISTKLLNHECIKYPMKKKSLRKVSVQSDNTIKRLHKKSLHQSSKNQNQKLQDFRKTKKSLSQTIKPQHQKIKFKNTENTNGKILFQEQRNSLNNKFFEHNQIKNRKQIFLNTNMNNKYRKIEPVQVIIIEKINSNNKSAVSTTSNYTEWTKQTQDNKQKFLYKLNKQDNKYFDDLNQTESLLRNKRNNSFKHNDQIRNLKHNLTVNEQDLNKMFSLNLSMKVPVSDSSNRFQNNSSNPFQDKSPNQIQYKFIKESNKHSNIKLPLNVHMEAPLQIYSQSSLKVSQSILTQKKIIDRVKQKQSSKHLQHNIFQQSDKIIDKDQQILHYKNYHQHDKYYDQEVSITKKVKFPNYSTTYNPNQSTTHNSPNCSINNSFAVDNVTEKKKLQHIKDYLNFQITLSKRNLSKNNGIVGKPIKLCCSQQFDNQSQGQMSQNEKQNHSQVSLDSKHQINDLKNTRFLANQSNGSLQKHLQKKYKAKGLTSGLTSLLQNGQQLLHTIKQIEIDPTIDQDIVKDLNKMYKRQIFSQQSKLVVPHFIQKP